MKKKQPPANPTDDLRVEEGQDQGKISGEDENLLVHERQEHQVELEMKDRELLEAQETIEEARSSYEALYDFAPMGYFSFSRKGKIIQVNLTGAGLLGVNQGPVGRSALSPLGGAGVPGGLPHPLTEDV